MTTATGGGFLSLNKKGAKGNKQDLLLMLRRLDIIGEHNSIRI
jgi:hypothetical protein